MIAKITRGSRMRGLVTYLFGEGRREEHEQPHVIAASTGIEVDHGRELTAKEQHELATQLDTPQALFGAEIHGGHVWHLSLTNHRDDGQLSDEQWAEAVGEVMGGLGFDDASKAPAPWVAIRHGISAGGNDHVHVAVSLVREDGSEARTWNDRPKVSAVCKELEERFQLTVVGGRHGPSDTRWPDREEFEAAQRDESRPAPIEGEPRWTPSQEMAVIVRGVAAASIDEAEFVRRLYDAGYEVRPREAPGDHTKVVGYAVRQIDGADHRWRAGGKLARDLALPKLREQWAARGGKPIDDERTAWRSPARPPARYRSADFDEIPVDQRGEPDAREAQPVDVARWDDAVSWTRETTAAVETGTVDPADVAKGAAGVAAALSARLEADQPGPIAGLAAQLARHPRSERRPADDTTTGKPDYLVGALAAAAVIAVQGTRIGSRLSVLVLAVELARLADAIAERNRTRQQLAYARSLQRSTEPVRTAAAASRDGTGPWTIDTATAPKTPPPPEATAPQPQRATRTATTDHDELRRRQHEQQHRDNDRGR